MHSTVVPIRCLRNYCRATITSKTRPASVVQIPPPCASRPVNSHRRPFPSEHVRRALTLLSPSIVAAAKALDVCPLLYPTELPTAVLCEDETLEAGPVHFVPSKSTVIVPDPEPSPCNSPL